MAIVKQIANLVNDAVADALGKNASLTTLDTTSIVSLGKAISEFDAYEQFYGALVNRIVKTVYFVRQYSPKSRNVLRDEHEFGAFIQKVYTEMPTAVNNPTFAVVTDEVGGGKSYQQHSPYDVETVIGVTAKIIGGTQGTWSHEFIVQYETLKSAFLSDSEMMRLIDTIYLTADNRMKLDIEYLENTAVNTSMASSIAGGKARNLLDEYNTLHPTNTLTVAQCLEDLDFLKYATKEISMTIKFMGYMTGNFNTEDYLTYTSPDNLVVEMLSHFVKATESYLQADTYHKELVSLPKYSEVSFWQNPGETFDFATCSAIKVKNSAINSGTAVSQGGIICFLRDVENTAAYFGRRSTWEMPNPRDELIIHGEKARKGYGVDTHANAFVFYIAEE